ncbi:unnamed protein product [Clonostachys rosea]|uniref:Uncharacterized protein n=1 Tax=Bionectria ochroleuca TaxID=29856 RepID=A0ABY6TYA4_BIOOC|nr:unnamed protein product [Clonostachys rosea]
MSGTEVFYVDEDIRSSPAHQQVVELSTLGSHPPWATITTAATFEPVKCLLHLIRQVYYILTIQSALAGQRFLGDTAAEAHNTILRLAWVRRPLHAVEDCYELICSQLGQYNDIFDLLTCDAMAATLWNRPEFHIDDVPSNYIASWNGFLPFPAFFSNDIVRQHSAPIVDEKLPAIFKLICTGLPFKKQLPAIFTPTPTSEQIRGRPDNIGNPGDVVYVLMAIVAKREGKKPTVKRFNPLTHRIISQETIPEAEGSRYMIFYAKFRRCDLDQGGRVQQMLNVGPLDGALARPVEETLPGLMEGLEFGDGQAVTQREDTRLFDDRGTKRTRRSDSF